MDKILKIDLIDDSEKIEVNLTDYNDTEIKQEIKELQDNQFSGDYNDLTNKPTIPTKTSDLQNDSGYVTTDTDDLENYYTKSETYNKSETYDKTEIDNKVSSVYKYKGSVATYNDLPSSGLSVGDVYNVEDTGDNYAWTGTAWDKLGGSIDLSDYVKNTDYATNSVGGVVKVDGGYALQVSPTGAIRGLSRTVAQYGNLDNASIISKGTLENVLPEKLSTKVDKVEGKGLSTNDYTDEDKEKLAELDEEVETIEGDLYGDITDTTTTGEIVIQNSVEGRDLAIDELDGYAEQKTTDGRNVFDNTINSQYSIQVSQETINTGKRITYTNSTSTTSNVFAVFVVKDMTDYVGSTIRCKADFSPSANNMGQFYIGLCESDGSNRSSKSFQTESGGLASFVVPELSGNQTYLCVALYANMGGATCNTDDFVDYTNIIITIDNQNVSWEEFTGGSASPNPSFPQTPNLLTGDNLVTITNGNLLCSDNFESGKVGANGDEVDSKYGRNKGYIRVSPSTTYTLSAKDTLNRLELMLYDGNKVKEISGSISTNNNRVSITTGVNTRYLRFDINVNNSTDVTSEIMKNLNLMLAEGTSTTFKPYATEQLISLGDIVLGKLNDYLDKIYYDNADGKWYLHKELGKYTFTGDEDFYYDSNGNRFAVNNVIEFAGSTVTRYPVLCNRFGFVASGNPIGYGMFIYRSAPISNYQIYVYDKDYNTSADLKTYFRNNETYFYYPLKTPTNTEITNTTLLSQLEAIRKLKQYDDETIITIDDIKIFSISYDGNKIEKIESDLEDKVGFTDYATNSIAGIVRADKGFAVNSSTGVVSCNTKTYQDYGTLPTSYFIGKGTLDNVIEGKGLVSNTDYATTSVGGVVKMSASLGTSMRASGVVQSSERTYEQYSSDESTLFISKGTLENVVEGKKLTAKPNVDDEIMKNTMPFPNFEDMEKVATYEYDVSDTNYHTIYTIANTGWNEMNMDVLVAYRMTITGTNINQVIDVVDLWHYACTYPLTSALSKTLSVASATSGIRGTRAVYPATSYINDTNYPMAMEFYTYSNDTRRVKIEVFKTNSVVTWANVLTNATYSDSTHHGSNAISYYNMRGWLFRKPVSFVATGADVATRVGSYEPYAIGSSSIKTGTSITGNHITFLADDGLVYDISNTAKNISVGISRVGLIPNSYTSNKAINQSDMRTAVLLTSGQTALIPHATMALGNRLYLRCTMDANGKIHSDNYLDTEMRAGYTWMPFGFATASNALYMDTRNQSFYTLDANGELTHINGLKIAGNMDAFLDNINGEVI